MLKGSSGEWTALGKCFFFPVYSCYAVHDWDLSVCASHLCPLGQPPGCFCSEAQLVMHQWCIKAYDADTQLVTYR